MRPKRYFVTRERCSTISAADLDLFGQLDNTRCLQDVTVDLSIVRLGVWPMFPFGLIRTDSTSRTTLGKGTSPLSMCRKLFRIPVLCCVFVQGADPQATLKSFDKRMRRVASTVATCTIISHDFITPGAQRFHIGASSSFQPLDNLSCTQHLAERESKAPQTRLMLSFIGTPTGILHEPSLIAPIERASCRRIAAAIGHDAADNHPLNRFPFQYIA